MPLLFQHVKGTAEMVICYMFTIESLSTVLTTLRPLLSQNPARVTLHLVEALRKQIRCHSVIANYVTSMRAQRLPFMHLTDSYSHLQCIK